MEIDSMEWKKGRMCWNIAVKGQSFDDGVDRRSI